MFLYQRPWLMLMLMLMLDAGTALMLNGFKPSIISLNVSALMSNNITRLA